MNSSLFSNPTMPLEGSLLMDDDMFYSANPPGFRKDSAVDMSDSASVSTFGANSTFSTTNGMLYENPGFLYIYLWLLLY